MGLIKSIKKRYNWILKVQFDKISGFYFYKRFNQTIFIRHPRHFLGKKENEWLCEKIFYHYYLPHSNDTVVDVGAGYGEEAIYLASKSPDIRFVGVEAQPSIYECLSNTLYNLHLNFKAVPYAINDDGSIFLSSHFSYAAVGNNAEGYIEVPGISWEAFIKKYHLETIDLLKMNIEGAEKALLSSVTDFAKIKRLIISCHDFRANSGDGEHYRTKEFVVNVLKQNNYDIKTFDYGRGWSEDWIYAEQKNL